MQPTLGIRKRLCLPDFSLQQRAAACAIAAAFAAVVVVVVGLGAGTADATPDSGQKTIVDAIADAPDLSFDDDGLPVIVYNEFNPSGPTLDEDGQPIPDPGGPRLFVLACSDTHCSETPAFNTRLPQTGQVPLGFVIGREVIFSSEGSDAYKICDAAACSGGLVAISIRANTSSAASVIDMAKGTDGSHHVAVWDGSGETERSWLLRCVLASCPATDVVEVEGRITSLAISPDGSPVAAIASSDGSIALLACTTPNCASDEPTLNIAKGTDAVAARGATGHPIVGVLEAGALSAVHCGDPSCTEQVADDAVLIAPAPGAVITDLTFAATLSSGAPVIGHVEQDEANVRRFRATAITPCAVERCAGGGEPTPFFTPTDLAVSPSGIAHVVSATFADSVSDMAERDIDHTTCDRACQCKRTLCGAQTIRDVCGTGRADVALELELAVDVGDLVVVDLALGEVPGPEAELILGTNQSEALVVDANDSVCAGAGNDRIEFVALAEGMPGPETSGWAFGGNGDDYIDLSLLDAGVAYGDVGNDTMIGSAGSDLLHGEGGDDLIVGSAGDDEIRGGPGDDRVWGGAGDDRIDGESGADRIRGGAGNDMIRGGSGDAAGDDINGSSGDDVIFGNDGPDILRGGTGSDEVYGGNGDDVLINGNGGEDLVVGGDGNDALVAGGPRPDNVQGGPGDDLVKGNGGADTLSGGPGDDEIRGGPQPDTIFGGADTDDCFGGSEPDTFDGCEQITE